MLVCLLAFHFIFVMWWQSMGLRWFQVSLSYGCDPFIFSPNAWKHVLPSSVEESAGHNWFNRLSCEPFIFTMWQSGVTSAGMVGAFGRLTSRLHCLRRVASPASRCNDFLLSLMIMLMIFNTNVWKNNVSKSSPTVTSYEYSVEIASLHPPCSAQQALTCPFHAIPNHLTPSHTLLHLLYLLCLMIVMFGGYKTFTFQVFMSFSSFQTVYNSTTSVFKLENYPKNTSPEI